MTNTPRGDGPEPTQPLGPSYPAYSDPAYADQSPYGPTYQPPQVPDPTQQLAPYSPYGYDPYATGQYGPPYPPGEPPGGPPSPKTPRWLWVVAATAVLLVIGLVIALVVANSSKQDSVVAPPPMPEPTTPTTTRTPTTTSLRPLPPIVPVPTTTPPSESVTPGATETVVYEVNGDGRAINITYVDTGSVLQTEFNVVLPWRKEVELPSPADDSASLTIINVGREVTCSVTINGVQVEANTGNGLTICTAVR
jgi:Mycobacterium membrane protein